MSDLGRIVIEGLSPDLGKRELLDWLQAEGRLQRREVGRINLRRRTATVELETRVLARTAAALDGTRLDGRVLSVWADTAATADRVGKHVAKLLHWLQLEAAAEEAAASGAGARGQVGDSPSRLVRLVVRSAAADFGRRERLTLGRRRPQEPLPWHTLTPGTPVLVRRQEKPSSPVFATVAATGSHTLEVLHAGREDYAADELLIVAAAPNPIARSREELALKRVRSCREGRLAELRDVLIGLRPPRFTADSAFSALDTALDASQRAAVSHALAAADAAVIHGPPGTGKTTAVIELIRQACRRGDRVLACAPSNLAVDNLCQRLVADKVAIVRLGHPVRVSDELKRETLDGQLQQHPQARAAAKLADELAGLRQTSRGRPTSEMQALSRELRQLEADMVDDILDRAAVVCATLNGLDAEILGARRFGLAVIDEAGQSTEPACWLAIARAERLVLAGDHCQLPPTVISEEAAAGGYACSLMERLNRTQGEQISRQLTVQYRMHEAIMAFSSAVFYDGSLAAHDAVRRHLLTGLAGVADDELTTTPLHFVDTSGANYEEVSEAGDDSRANPEEAGLVRRLVSALLGLGVPPAAVLVISPYAAQVRLLVDRLSDTGVEVATIDGCQGRENEVVVISLVRSNPRNEIGFLSETRRLNVAITRARRKLIVVGDSATLAGHEFFDRLLDHFDRHGAYHTVWEYD